MMRVLQGGHVLRQVGHSLRIVVQGFCMPAKAWGGEDLRDESSYSSLIPSSPNVYGRLQYQMSRVQLSMTMTSADIYFKAFHLTHTNVCTYT